MPEEKTVLFICTDWDVCTYYGSYYMQAAVDYAKSKNMEAIVIRGQEVTEAAVMQAIKDYDPLYVIFVGHGCLNLVLANQSSDVFYIPIGCEGRPHNTSNIDILKDRIVFLLACDTDNLTKSISDIGAKQIFGFDATFGWVVDAAGGYDPATDKYAPTFFTPVVAMISGLLDGTDVKTLNQIYRQNVDQLMAQWNSTVDAKSEVVTSWLESNKDSLIVFSEGSLSVGGVAARLGVLWLLGVAVVIYCILTEDKK